jgi:tetratricopeptide (TPR) repeat protein
MRKLTLFAVIALALALPVAAQEILFDQMVEAAGLKCFPIQGDPTTWYYLPDRPHLVTDADGNPEFSFLMYVTPTKQGESGINKAPGGGIVHFLVAYDVPQEQVRRAQTEVGRKKPNAKLVGPVNYVEGTFALVTAVTDPQAGLSRRVVGVGNAPLMAGHKAAVSIHLAPEGASLLWESFKQRTPDISVAFEMTVSGYRNPVEAAMSIDWQKVNQTIQIEAAGRYSFIAAEVDIMLQKMRNNGAIKVELKGAPPSQWNDIQSLGLELARQYLFESQGASGLAGLGAAGTQQSPLDRLWKLYGDEWKQQQKTSDLRLVPPELQTGFSFKPVRRGVSRPSPPSLLFASLDGAFPLAAGRTGRGPGRRGGVQPARSSGELVLAANRAVMLGDATPNYWPQVFENVKRGEELLRERRCTEALVAFRNARFNVILQLGYEPEQTGRAAGMQLYVTAREAMAAVCANQPTPMMEALTAFVVAARQVGRSTLAARGDTLRDSLQATSGQVSLGQQEEVDRQVTDINRRSSRAGAAQHPRSSESEAMPEPRREAAALYDRGIEQYYDGQLHEAAQAFVDAIRLAPDCADCFYNLAIIGVELGQRDAALNYLDRLFEARPDYGGIVFMRNARDAIAGTSQPISPERRPQLAEYLAAMDANAQALLASSPGTTAAAGVGGSGAASPKPGAAQQATYGTHQDQPLGDPQQQAAPSSKSDQKVGPLTPDQEQAKAWFKRGMNLYNMGEYKEALEMFEASAGKFSTPETQWNIGLTHVRLGHTQQAVAAIDSYIGGKGGDASHPKLRATVDALAGEPQPMPSERRDEWVEKLKQADQVDQTSAGTGQPPPAGGEAAAKHAVSGPGSETLCEQASTLFAKGLEAWDGGRTQDAINYLEQADNLCHKPDYTWNLFVSHLALGQRDLALAYLDRYLQEVAECRKKPLVAAARDLIAAAPAQIPDEMRVPLWRPIEDACGSIPVKSMKVGATGAAGAEQALATLPAVAAGGPTKTPTPTPKKGALPGVAGAGAAAAGAGATPTRTATRATPTATPKAEKPTNWGVIASFKLRRIESTGAFNLNLKQWLRTDQAVRFAANIGDLSNLMGNPRFFRRVNLDDPVFKQREIPVTVDVRGEDAFADMLNAVTVTLKKRHESGKESLGEVTISRAEFARGAPQTLVYGWDQDNNRTRWLDYEVRQRWNYVGGPVIETPWIKTSAGALVLEPPLRPRPLMLEADPTFLQEQGVRDVVVEVHYRAGDADRIATATVRASAPSGETRLLLYQDPQQPGYSYSYTWRLRGGDRRAAGPFTETADIIYLDEVPPGS